MKMVNLITNNKYNLGNIASKIIYLITIFIFCDQFCWFFNFHLNEEGGNGNDDNQW